MSWDSWLVLLVNLTFLLNSWWWFVLFCVLMSALSNIYHLWGRAAFLRFILLFDPLTSSTSSSASHSALALVPPHCHPLPCPQFMAISTLPESPNCTCIILAPIVGHQCSCAEPNALEKWKLMSLPLLTSTSFASCACSHSMGKLSKDKVKLLPVDIPLHGPWLKLCIWISFTCCLAI